MGHSLGGKLAMRVALRRPELVDRLMVVDISPARNEAAQSFAALVAALRQLDIDHLTSRTQADREPTPAATIVPVCGAGYRAGRARPRHPVDLLAHQLVRREAPFRPAATWRDWFASAGIEGRRVPKGLQINDYVSVIQSVIAGQGIALGWDHLVDMLVSQGVLVPLTDHVLTTGMSFHVIWPRGVTLTKAAQEVRDWLLAQAHD